MDINNLSAYSTEDLDNAYLLNAQNGGSEEITKAIGKEIDRRVLSRLVARNKK